MKKYVCVHGHFYQPPRENPWTGMIAQQESAEPFHDWNQRITSECYTPNTQTKILNNQNQAIKVANNFSKISFNVGPTLLSWMQSCAPETYDLILSADKNSMDLFSGHGSAIAQGYNHMILPLCNDNDLKTQVMWGIEDFKYRFQREPEGMWLPETAVNIRTLNALAEQNIKFTILSPAQAQSVRRIGEEQWNDVSEGTIDIQLPYTCRLPSGKTITLFFYQGAISNEVAFGNLLKNGVGFAERLIEEFPEHQKRNRLVHIANDGETYGHHHAFGNMALAYMLYHIETNQMAKITNYGEFLAQNPPEYEVKIIDDTSWSCFHGVDRWKAHCGCRLDEEQDWSQEWRSCLRDTLDWLREKTITFYEQSMRPYFKDPWDVRNRYISIILKNEPEHQRKLISEWAGKALTEDDCCLCSQVHLL